MRVSPWRQTPWDWRASIQFICGGSGAGLLLFTALAAFAEPVWLLRTGLLALAFVSLGLLSVWVKLGRRWRFLFVFLNPFTSWMTREAFLSLPLLGLGLLAVLLSSAPLALAAGLIGLGFLYAQARILRAALGIPAWREPWIAPLIVTTGLTEGAALLLLASAVFGAVGVWTPIVVFILIAVRLLVWTTYRRRLSAPGAAPLRTVEVLAAANRSVVSVGHGLPLALLPIIIFVPALAPLASVIAGLAALLAGWQLKFTVIARAAYNQGFAIERTPARTPGYGGPGVKPGWG